MGVREYRASQLNALVKEYVSGPIVDAALAALRPSKTPGIGGAGRLLVWKTNNSTQAAQTMADSGGDNVLTTTSRSWGTPGNRLSVRVETLAADSTKRAFTVLEIGKSDESLGSNPSEDILVLTNTGSIDITTSILATGGAETKILSIGSQNFDLSDNTIETLAEDINSKTAITIVATTPTIKHLTTPATDLDAYSATDGIILGNSASITLKRLQEEVVEVLNTSTKVSAELSSVVRLIGASDSAMGVFRDLVLEPATYNLLGGTTGMSSTSSFSLGLDSSFSTDWNVVVPCISRDATEDISEGLTNSRSTYEIDDVLAATESHLRLRGDIKNKKEAQGIVGIRSASKSVVYDAARTLNSELVQLAMQDVLTLNTSGILGWKQPYIMAALLAGMRTGTSVGEPLTHKFINASNAGHHVNTTTGMATGDFDTAMDVEEAIDAGVIFVESANNGQRVVVDNTTYGTDNSFVFNRGSVIEAAHYVARSIRDLVEAEFIGSKITNTTAGTVKAFIRSELEALNATDVNIITSSDDAPRGYVEETFVVTVQGNTINVQLEFKPVQGLDFVFIDFTLGDIRQSA